MFNKIFPFNSTRYIRNLSEFIEEHEEELLSTPHGTLGTYIVSMHLYIKIFKAFNSTRYIRNNISNTAKNVPSQTLSTPHGALGTPFSVPFPY